MDLLPQRAKAGLERADQCSAPTLPWPTPWGCLHNQPRPAAQASSQGRSWVLLISTSPRSSSSETGSLDLGVIYNICIPGMVPSVKSKSLNLFVVPFPHLWNGDNNSKILFCKASGFIEIFKTKNILDWGQKAAWSPWYETNTEVQTLVKTGNPSESLAYFKGPRSSWGCIDLNLEQGKKQNTHSSI